MTERIQEMMNEGIAYIQAKEYMEAEKIFVKILENDKKCFDVYMHLGNVYVNLKKFDESIKAFKTALMLDPESGIIHFNIGSVYFLKEDWLNAIVHFNKAEEKEFRCVELYLIKATIFQQSEDYVQAIREISKAIQLKPFQPELYVRKAHLQIEMGQMESAVETGETLRQLLPDAFEGYELGVWIYSTAEQYEKALALSDEGKKKFPEDPAFSLLKLDIYRNLKEYEKTNALTDELLTLELETKTRIQIALYKAEACGYLGRVQEMKQILEMYKDEDTEGKLLYMLMMIYSGEKRYDELRDIAQKLEVMNVNLHYVVAAKFCHAEAVLNTDGEEEAGPMYQKLTKEFRSMTISNPNFYEVYIYRILCHTFLKEYEEAMDLADFLVKAYPEMADGHLYKYHIYKKMGKETEAKEERERALEINPKIKVQW